MGGDVRLYTALIKYYYIYINSSRRPKLPSLMRCALVLKLLLFFLEIDLLDKVKCRHSNVKPSSKIVSMSYMSLNA